MKIEGATRDEAVSKLKAMMNDSMLSTHMKEKHPGEPMIPVAQVHAMIEQNVRAA